MTFEQWYTQADNHYGYTPLDLAREAWDEATQAERERAAGHVKNYLNYPALIIEALWHIEHGNPIESSMTKEQKEKANGV